MFYCKHCFRSMVYSFLPALCKSTVKRLLLFCDFDRHGVISVTMYNFGSPRVGNKRFAEAYNKVKADVL